MRKLIGIIQIIYSMCLILAFGYYLVQIMFFAITRGLYVALLKKEIVIAVISLFTIVIEIILFIMGEKMSGSFYSKVPDKSQQNSVKELAIIALNSAFLVMGSVAYFLIDSLISIRHILMLCPAPIIVILTIILLKNRKGVEYEKEA